MVPAADSAKLAEASTSVIKHTNNRKILQNAFCALWGYSAVLQCCTEFLAAGCLSAACQSFTHSAPLPESPSGSRPHTDCFDKPNDLDKASESDVITNASALSVEEHVLGLPLSQPLPLQNGGVSTEGVNALSTSSSSSASPLQHSKEPSQALFVSIPLAKSPATEAAQRVVSHNKRPPKQRSAEKDIFMHSVDIFNSISRKEMTSYNALFSVPSPKENGQASYPKEEVPTTVSSSPPPPPLGDTFYDFPQTRIAQSHLVEPRWTSNTRNITPKNTYGVTTHTFRFQSAAASLGGASSSVPIIPREEQKQVSEHAARSPTSQLLQHIPTHLTLLRQPGLKSTKHFLSTPSSQSSYSSTASLLIAGHHLGIARQRLSDHLDVLRCAGCVTTPAERNEMATEASRLLCEVLRTWEQLEPLLPSDRLSDYLGGGSTAGDATAVPLASRLLRLVEDLYCTFANQRAPTNTEGPPGAAEYLVSDLHEVFHKAFISLAALNRADGAVNPSSALRMTALEDGLTQLQQYAVEDAAFLASVRTVLLRLLEVHSESEHPRSGVNTEPHSEGPLMDTAESVAAKLQDCHGYEFFSTIPLPFVLCEALSSSSPSCSNNQTTTVETKSTTKAVPPSEEHKSLPPKAKSVGCSGEQKNTASNPLMGMFFGLGGPSTSSIQIPTSLPLAFAPPSAHATPRSSPPEKTRDGGAAPAWEAKPQRMGLASMFMGRGGDSGAAPSAVPVRVEAVNASAEWLLGLRAQDSLSRFRVLVPRAVGTAAAGAGDTLPWYEEVASALEGHQRDAAVEWLHQHAALTEVSVCGGAGEDLLTAVQRCGRADQVGGIPCVIARLVVYDTTSGAVYGVDAYCCNKSDEGFGCEGNSGTKSQVVGLLFRNVLCAGARHGTGLTSSPIASEETTRLNPSRPTGDRKQRSRRVKSLGDPNWACGKNEKEGSEGFCSKKMEVTRNELEHEYSEKVPKQLPLSGSLGTEKAKTPQESAYICSSQKSKNSSVRPLAGGSAAMEPDPEMVASQQSHQDDAFGLSPKIVLGSPPIDELPPLAPAKDSLISSLVLTQVVPSQASSAASGTASSPVTVRKGGALTAVRGVGSSTVSNPPLTVNVSVRSDSALTSTLLCDLFLAKNSKKNDVCSENPLLLSESSSTSEAPTSAHNGAAHKAKRTRVMSGAAIFSAQPSGHHRPPLGFSSRATAGTAAHIEAVSTTALARGKDVNDIKISVLQQRLGTQLGISRVGVADDVPEEVLCYDMLLVMMVQQFLHHEELHRGITDRDGPGYCLLINRCETHLVLDIIPKDQVPSNPQDFLKYVDDVKLYYYAREADYLQLFSTPVPMIYTDQKESPTTHTNWIATILSRSLLQPSGHKNSSLPLTSFSDLWDSASGMINGGLVRPNVSSQHLHQPSGVAVLGESSPELAGKSGMTNSNVVSGWRNDFNHVHNGPSVNNEILSIPPSPLLVDDGPMPEVWAAQVASQMSTSKGVVHPKFYLSDVMRELLLSTGSFFVVTAAGTASIASPFITQERLSVLKQLHIVHQPLSAIADLGLVAVIQMADDAKLMKCAQNDEVEERPNIVQLGYGITVAQEFRREALEKSVHIPTMEEVNEVYAKASQETTHNAVPPTAPVKTSPSKISLPAKLPTDMPTGNSATGSTTECLPPFGLSSKNAQASKLVFPRPIAISSEEHAGPTYGVTLSHPLSSQLPSSAECVGKAENTEEFPLFLASIRADLTESSQESFEPNWNALSRTRAMDKSTPSCHPTHAGSSLATTTSSLLQSVVPTRDTPSDPVKPGPPTTAGVDAEKLAMKEPTRLVDTIHSPVEETGTSVSNLWTLPQKDVSTVDRRLDFPFFRELLFHVSDCSGYLEWLISCGHSATHVSAPNQITGFLMCDLSVYEVIFIEWNTTIMTPKNLALLEKAKQDNFSTPIFYCILGRGVSSSTPLPEHCPPLPSDVSPVHLLYGESLHGVVAQQRMSIQTQIQLGRIMQNLRGDDTLVYQVVNRISSGSVGDVYEVSLYASNGRLAMKRIPIGAITLDRMDQLYKEVAIMRELDHRNIVQFSHTNCTKAFLNIFMELCECSVMDMLESGLFPLGDVLSLQQQRHGSLTSLTPELSSHFSHHHKAAGRHSPFSYFSQRHSNQKTVTTISHNHLLPFGNNRSYHSIADSYRSKNRSYNPEAVRKTVRRVDATLIIRDVVSAVKYLHSFDIVHRDIKPQNVLFLDGVAKLADFGSAATVNGTQDSLRTMKGTVPYMAPEVLLGESYRKPCDIWSLGILFAEMLGLHLAHFSLLDFPALQEFYKSLSPEECMPVVATNYVDNTVKKHFSDELGEAVRAAMQKAREVGIMERQKAAVTTLTPLPPRTIWADGPQSRAEGGFSSNSNSSTHRSRTIFVIDVDVERWTMISTQCTLPTSLIELLESAFHRNPEKRITAEQLLEHPIANDREWLQQMFVKIQQLNLRSTDNPPDVNELMELSVSANSMAVSV